MEANKNRTVSKLFGVINLEDGSEDSTEPDGNDFLFDDTHFT